MQDIIKKENNWVNLIKLICVLIIVLGHYDYTDWVGTGWLPHIVKSAVSVMFIYSGYYLSKNKMLEDQDKVKNYLGHLAIMTIVWVFIYFLRDVYYSEKTLEAVNEIFQNTMFDFTRFDSGHLWYIQNLFLAVAVMFAFQKRHFKVWEVILFIALKKCYYWLLICSLAGIGIGFILAESNKCFDKKRLFVCLCTGTVATVILCGFSYGWLNVPYSLSGILIETMKYVLATSVAVVGFCMDSLVPLKLGVAGRYIRKISTVIYLSHNWFVEYTFKVATYYGGVWGEKRFFVYSAGTAILLSFATGIGLIAVSEWKPFRILKKIY